MRGNSLPKLDQVSTLSYFGRPPSLQEPQWVLHAGCCRCIFISLNTDTDLCVQIYSVPLATLHASLSLTGVTVRVLIMCDGRFPTSSSHLFRFNGLSDSYGVSISRSAAVPLDIFWYISQFLSRVALLTRPQTLLKCLKCL